jgi:hypothetical protein
MSLKSRLERLEGTTPSGDLQHEVRLAAFRERTETQVRAALTHAERGHIREKVAMLRKHIY